MDDQARALLAQYGLDDARLTFVAHTHNYVYAVHSTQGDYMLRLQPLATKPRLEQEIMHLKLLAGRAPVPRLHATPTGAWLVQSAAQVGILLERLAGEPPAPAQITSDDMQRFGQTLAQLHAALPTLPHAPRGEWESLFSASGAYPMTGLLAHLSSRQAEIVTETMQQLSTMLTAADTQPASLLHGDFVLHNLLVDATQVHLIDFEYSRYGQPAYDVGTLLWQVRARPDWTLMQAAVLAGYGWERCDDGWLVVRQLASLHWVANNRDVAGYSGADEILAQRVQELSDYLQNGVLIRRPLTR